MTQPPPQTEERSELEALASEQLAKLGETLAERPLVAVALGVGIGILLARLLGDR
jgi:ElaB/YqjD/DUF883 family membrane-anchored ribosome-binding protein